MSARAGSEIQVPGQLIFLLGTGRCGSTLLEEVLARHPDVGFISNVDAYLGALAPKGRWNNLLYARTPDVLSQRDRLGRFQTLQKRLHYGPSEAWSLLFKEVSPTVVAPFRDLTEDDVTPWLRRRFERFYRDRMVAQGKAFFLHKYTGWPRARFLNAIFPNARFVHVIRDGRAVASSLLQMPWWKGYLGPSEWRFGPLPEEYEREWMEAGRSFVALAGIEWKVMMDAFDLAARAIPRERWLDVRYEDLVGDPRAGIERTLEWLGLSWTEEFEARFSRHVFSTSRRQGYLNDLSGPQIELLNRLLGDHLRRLGYLTSGPNRASL
jgi:Sulfotransferase family